MEIEKHKARGHYSHGKESDCQRVLPARQSGSDGNIDVRREV